MCSEIAFFQTAVRKKIGSSLLPKLEVEQF